MPWASVGENMIKGDCEAAIMPAVMITQKEIIINFFTLSEVQFLCI